MSRKACHRNPVFCVVPPYDLDAIARNGTSQRRVAALQTKAVDNTFRVLRIATRASNTQNLSGTLVRAAAQGTTGDPTVDEAYEGLGATFDFFEQVFGRNSIDDDGMLLDATVHFGNDYNNAFWNSLQMAFGDGDGVIFNRFTIGLDMIGHDLPTAYETVSQADWLIGAGLLGPGVNGVALRSIADPGSAFNAPLLGVDPQPKHMDENPNVGT